MVKRYGSREAEHVYLVPVKSNLDCEHNFPDLKAPWNAQTKVEGMRLNNGLHPAAEGYRQIGDTIYCWMKAQLAPATILRTSFLALMSVPYNGGRMQEPRSIQLTTCCH